MHLLLRTDLLQQSLRCIRENILSIRGLRIAVQVQSSCASACISPSSVAGSADGGGDVVGSLDPHFVSMETKGKPGIPTDRLPDKQTAAHVMELFSAGLVYFDIHSRGYWELNFMVVTLNCWL